MFDKLIRGILGLFGWHKTLPFIKKLSWDQFREKLTDGCFLLVRKVNPDRISDAIEDASKSAWSHTISYYENCGMIIEAEPEGLIIQNIGKYNSDDFQLCAFVFPLTKGEVEGLKKWYTLRLNTPYPYQELAHDALPELIPNVTDKWDCSGATACAWNEIITRFKIYPNNDENGRVLNPVEITPGQIYNYCEPQVENCQMIKYNC